MTKLTFNRKPMPIFAEYRPLYKVSQLLMVLMISSRGGKSSIVRLHLFNWALKNDKRKEALLSASKTGTLDIDVWGLDPSLNAAIQFAVAEKLVTQNSSGITLERKGKDFLGDILKNELMVEDKNYLEKIGKKITERMILKVSESWG
ncbi:hypothetical protein [Franzmannia pantelleriensis]|uniref:hypothetical protein n=1 Tax=Franzmannia pantelleriensis TaxID=48727 RepID=UPI000B7EAAF5|nr:hypothetical protein [Halomonas pantelleriensis]